MKLYATTFIDEKAPDGQEKLVKWSGTQADQKRDAKQAKTDGFWDIRQVQVDVPTDKPGLLAFLNDQSVLPITAPVTQDDGL